LRVNANPLAPRHVGLDDGGMEHESQKAKNAGAIVAAIIAGLLGAVLLLACAGFVGMLWLKMRPAIAPQQAMPQVYVDPAPTTVVVPEPGPPPEQPEIVPQPDIVPQPTSEEPLYLAQGMELELGRPTISVVYVVVGGLLCVGLLVVLVVVIVFATRGRGGRQQ
jgi:hypothetical protein